MRTGWTGGQYSLWRAALGTFLAAFFARGFLDTCRGLEALAADAPLKHAWIGLESPTELAFTGLQPYALFGVELAACVALAIGWWDRIAALVLLLSLVWIDVTFPGIDANRLRLLDGLLVVQLLVPSAPYGSCAAAARADPGGGWSLPRGLGWTARVAWAAWVFPWHAWRLADWANAPVEMFQTWAWDAADDGALFLRWLGDGAPEFLRDGWVATSLCAVLYLPLASWPRAWPLFWWLLALGFLFGVVSTPPSELLGSGLAPQALLLALFFDPAWIPARGGEGVERLYYDGACGLCQRAVRFVLAEDPEGRRFRFAPLQGATFAREVDAATRSTLPDSVVVVAADGRVLARSAAVVHVLQRLGGFWRVLGTLMALVPRPLRDLGYDAVARLRKRLFAAPEELCPLGPGHVTDRFDP